jgi:hypothetical protein
MTVNRMSGWTKFESYEILNAPGISVFKYIEIFCYLAILHQTLDHQSSDQFERKKCR